MISPFIYTDAFAWHSLIYCFLFIVAILPIGFVNPRIMLQDYPKEIQAAVLPKTDKEKKQTIYFAVPLFISMMGYPSAISLYYKPVDPSFMYFFSTLWAMMLVFNVFDLLILDWIIFCTMTPRFMTLQGTEGHPGYKNYKFHFIGFLKGVVITGFLSAVLSGLLVFL